ncbi:hypothetical protein BJ912DRAFT_1063163 [Pholiota molesta]|nr:hypothetical protein BJ912DRAFT_1063163 [Pholiota molesta]
MDMSRTRCASLGIDKAYVQGRDGTVEIASYLWPADKCQTVPDDGPPLLVPVAHYRKWDSHESRATFPLFDENSNRVFSPESWNRLFRALQSSILTTTTAVASLLPNTLPTSPITDTALCCTRNAFGSKGAQTAICPKAAVPAGCALHPAHDDNNGECHVSTATRPPNSALPSVCVLKCAPYPTADIVLVRVRASPAPGLISPSPMNKPRRPSLHWPRHDQLPI